MITSGSFVMETGNSFGAPASCRGKIRRLEAGASNRSNAGFHDDRPTRDHRLFRRNPRMISMLFAVIGTAYGAGDGATTFNLPDMRNRFPLGVSGSIPWHPPGEPPPSTWRTRTPLPVTAATRIPSPAAPPNPSAAIPRLSAGAISALTGTTGTTSPAPPAASETITMTVRPAVLFRLPSLFLTHIRL